MLRDFRRSREHAERAARMGEQHSDRVSAGLLVFVRSRRVGVTLADSSLSRIAIAVAAALYVVENVLTAVDSIAASTPWL
jgi:hypothetical protein